MILTIQGVPCHLILLRGNAQASEEETRASSSKWLGFAKGYAIKCLNLSRQTHGWVTKTTKLPSSADTESETFQFLMIKCQADAKYCLIIIRASRRELIHGILLTPCSDLSPQGFGAPYTGDGVPDWGTPGFDLESGLDLSSYTGVYGGHAWQSVMVDSTQDPDAPESHLIYGPDWGKIIGFSRTSIASRFGDVAFGGAIAVTGTVAAEHQADGYMDSGTKSVDVFSVKGVATGWLNQGYSAVKLQETDVDRQANQLVYADGYAPEGSVIQYSSVDTSPIFKNGRRLALTNGDENQVYEAVGGGLRKIPLDGFVGVGVIKIDGVKRLVIIAVLVNTVTDAFTGDYALCYSDSPHKKFHFAQAFNLPHSVMGFYPKVAWQFNESCTRASGIAYGVKFRDGTDFDGGQIISETVEPELAHVDIDSGVTSCTVTVMESEGCKYSAESTTTSAESGTNQYGGPSRSATSDFTVTVGGYDAPIAVGYDGDDEKLLTLSYSEELLQSQTINDLKHFARFFRIVGYAGTGENEWISYDKQTIAQRSGSVSMQYAINGQTVASITRQKETYESASGLKSQIFAPNRWHDSGFPSYEQTEGSAEEMKNALAERFRSWNPSEWDRLSYSINLSMLDDDRATWWVEVNGQRYSSSGIGYEWYGYHSGTFVRYTFYTPPVTSSTESSTGGNTGINLISADLINDKLYYGLMEMDNDGTTTTVTFSIKCNDDVLYSETTVA